MKTSIKYESDTKVKVNVTLGADEIKSAEKVAINKLAKSLKVPGFRKGKAPVAVARKNIDSNVLQEETINSAISKAVAEAFISNGLQALDRPAVSVIKFVPGEVVEFTAEVEIMPAIKLGNYKKLKIDKLKLEISDQEVASTITRMREGIAEKKEVKREAKKDDEAIIDFVGKKGGKAFDGGAGNDYPLKLGSGQFIPGFEEAIIGHKAGQKFTIKVKFPDNYGSSELKGQPATFEINLKAVKELVLPELNDEFAKKVGNFKTLKELEEDIKKELGNQKQYEQKEKQKESLVEQLIKGSKIPTPEILIEDHIKMIEQDFINNLLYKGVTLEQYLDNRGLKTKEDWLKGEVRDLAIKRVKSGLVLAELSKQEKIVVDETEIEKSISEYKKHYSKNPEMLEQFNRPEIKQDITNRLLVEKTIERLVELNQ